MKFDNMTRLMKRVEHFCGPLAPELAAWIKAHGQWCAPLFGIRPEGAGIAAHNFAAMQDERDTYLDRILWADALADSLNRWIDRNRIDGDDNAKRVLDWWRAQMLFHPRGLA